jgi:predicted DNA-binding protein (MmcQ/YjbR family)
MKGASLQERLVSFSLGLPEAWEDHPWGETVAKVGKKVFVFFGQPSPGRFGMSVKLPSSREAALGIAGAKPTGYGLGKSGWVTIEIEGESPVPLEVLEDWLAESYAAVAPKRLVARLNR